MDLRNTTFTPIQKNHEFFEGEIIKTKKGLYKVLRCGKKRVETMFCLKIGKDQGSIVRTSEVLESLTIKDHPEYYL